MKKIILLTFIAISISIIFQNKLYATDITVGAVVWHAWIDKYTAEFPREKRGSELLYGPTLAAKINDDLNLTFIFLYGEYDKYDHFDRRESDLALNYRLDDNFKLFAGIKYMGYKDTFDTHNALGPGFGLSSTLPIIDNIFLIATLSGMYLLGIEKYDDTITKRNKKFNEYGANGTLAFAYYISSASTVISLGGRYQYYKTDYDGDSFNYKTATYGLTLTATYTF